MAIPSKEFKNVIIKDIPEYLIIEYSIDEDRDIKHSLSNDEKAVKIVNAPVESEDSDYFYELKDEVKEEILTKPLTEDEKTSLICETCGKSYKNKKSLRGHKLIHTNKNNTKSCEICGKVLAAVNYNRHLNSHNENNKHKCSFCDKTFHQLSNLKSHMTIHKKTEPVECNICNKTFRNPKSLCYHKKSHSYSKLSDNKPKKTSCHICGKLVSETNLRKHLITHTDDRPFKCKICDNMFKYPETLASHILIHENRKPYPCKYCDKKFRTSSEISKHTKIHLGLKSHKCSYCDKSFTTSTHLRTHTRVHTGQMPYKCDICSKDFRHSGTLKNHMKTHD